jgi:short subunit dehydrogenase-like uncharacterized protein
MNRPTFDADRRPFMVYGAYGFTGRLIVEEALRRGHRPVLSGRDEQRLQALAQPLGLAAIALRLDDASALQAALRPMSLVLNAAGPFTATGRAIIEACLATGAPYVDVSGEIAHLRAVYDLDERARKAGVALLTGAGFGVTYGDCLARHVVDRLPDATHLRLSVAASSAQTTSGVRRTILEIMAEGGWAVEGGEWKRRPLAHQTWVVKDGPAALPFAAAPLGELAAARLSTKVADIVVGLPMPGATAKAVRLVSPLIQGALRLPPLRRALGGDEGRPSIRAPEPKEGWRSRIWAEARNARGHRVMARLETGEGLAATARAALANVEALLARRLAGAFSPAPAFGTAHVSTIPGVNLTDLAPETGLPLEPAVGEARSP